MKQNEIVDSAKELFKKYGIKKTSMEEIAKNAGVTKKTVYSYFKSKGDLINYFAKEELNNMKKIVEKYNKKKANEDDYFYNVHQGLYELLLYRKESFIINLINDEAETLNMKEIKDSLKNIEKEVKNFIKTSLMQSIENGYIEVNNIEIATFLIYKMYIALIFEWDEDYKTLDEKEIADNVLHILKYGIKTRKGSKKYD